MARKVLLVCGGNTCRSPMAERLWNRLAQEAGLDVQAVSAGLYASAGRPASEGALGALRRRNLDASDHRTRPLTPELVEEADLVLTMTRAQKRDLLSQLPLAAGKVYTLAEFAEPERWHPLVERQERLRQEADRILAELDEVERQLEGMDVADPFGGGEEEYERCAARIEELVKHAVRRLASGG